MIRRHFFLFGALLVLAVVLVGGALKVLLAPRGPDAALTAQSSGPAQARGGRGGGAPTVSPVNSTVRDFTDRIDVLGVAKGRQSVTLTSATQQLVTRVLFQPGQYVRRGQALVELQSNAEDASIQSARARLIQAQRNFQRWNELARRGVAPRATVDQYQAAYETAQADLSVAQARRTDRTVRAPFAGRVGLSDIAPGALLNPGAPIVTLDDTSSIRVDFEVPDRFLAVIRPGAPIIARTDAYPDLRALGQIALLDTRIDERTRAITARAEIPNPTGQILPGMLIRIGVVQSQRQSVAVPESAVQFEGDQAFVFLLRRGERGLRVVREQVVIGLNQDGFLEIRSGLLPNAQVVADGLNRLQNGRPVTLAGERRRGETRRTQPGAQSGTGRPDGARGRPSGPPTARVPG